MPAELAATPAACQCENPAGRQTPDRPPGVGGLTDGRIKVTRRDTISPFHRYNRAPIIRTSPGRATHLKPNAEHRSLAMPQRAAQFALPLQLAALFRP